MTCGRCNIEPKCNDELQPKRLIQSHKKSNYWQIRNKSGAIEAILQPCCSESPKQSSTMNIHAFIPDGVKRTTSKIKFGNETSSRYHKHCLNTKQKPKRTRNTVKRNVTTETCIDCSGASKKREKFKNVCYCIRPPNKPMIPGGPEYTVPPPKENPKLRHCDGSCSEYRPETLKLAKDLVDYIPQSTFLSRMYRENCQKCMCNTCMLKAAGSRLKFTERRLHLEDAYHKLAECNRINFDKLSQLNCVNISGMHISPEKSREPSRSCSKKSFSKNQTSSEKINAVKEIRSDNYFETHSSSNLPTMAGGQPDHKCIFKFTINARGLLEPVNPDAYGTNRCSICNKAQPEESPDYKTSKTSQKEKTCKKVKLQEKQVCAAQSKGKNVKEVPSRGPKVTQIYNAENNFYLPKCRPIRNREYSSNREIPLKVCNPTLEKTVQLNIKDPQIYGKNARKGVPKYLTPANTWALRFQKGCSA